jgi:hypothetical protein
MKKSDHTSRLATEYGKHTSLRQVSILCWFIMHPLHKDASLYGHIAYTATADVAIDNMNKVNTFVLTHNKCLFLFLQCFHVYVDCLSDLCVETIHQSNQTTDNLKYM